VLSAAASAATPCKKYPTTSAQLVRCGLWSDQGIGQGIGKIKRGARRCGTNEEFHHANRMLVLLVRVLVRRLDEIGNA